MNQARKAQQSALPSISQMVLLAEPLSFSKDNLEIRLQEKVGSTQITVQFPNEGKDSFVVTWGKLAFAVMCIDKPVPASTFTTALHTSVGLKDGNKLVAEHKAHLVVSSLTASEHQGQAIFVAMGVMSLTNLLASMGKPLGYYWTNAQTLIDQRQIEHAISGIQAAMRKQANKEPNAGLDLPATFWVGIRMFSPDQKTQFGALTKGLIAFTGYELELEPIAWKPADIAQRVYGTVSYLFSNGPVLQDGQTIGVNKNEHFRIRKVPATSSLPPRVVLTLESA